jgi:NADH-quinone oxidoreductase subunit K
MVSLSSYLILSTILFALGAAGFLFKRNLLTLLMCVELMLNAVTLTFIAFSHALRQIDGQVLAFFALVVAAVQGAVGLAILIEIYRKRAELLRQDR